MDERIAPGEPENTSPQEPQRTTRGEELNSSREGALSAKPESRRALSKAQRVGVGVVAALSVILVAVSVYFLVPQSGEAADASNLLQTTQETASADQGSVGESTESQETETQGTEGSSEQSTESSSGATGAPDSTSAAGSGSAPLGSGSVNNGTSDTPQSPASNTVTVRVTVSSSAADGSVSGAATPTFEVGATVYDALCATGLSINAYNSPHGIYVNAIGGLAEKQYGGTSGWVYTVNGETISVSASTYILSDGDVVSWFYSMG